MRGKDLLEKLELVDSEYIQAASMPWKKKRITSKIAAVLRKNSKTAFYNIS